MRTFSVIGALIALSLMFSCGDSDSDSIIANLTANFDDPSDVQSLGLDEIFSVSTPAEISGESSASLALLAKTSQGQCHIKKITQHALGAVQRAGVQLCHYQEQGVEFPDVGETKKYQLTFDKPPHEKKRSISDVKERRSKQKKKKEEKSAKLADEKFIMNVQIQRPTENEWKIDMCDSKKKVRRHIYVKSDGVKRTGHILENRKTGHVTHARVIKFASKLPDEGIAESITTADGEIPEIKLFINEYLLRSSDDTTYGEQKRSSFVDLDIQNDGDVSTIAFSQNTFGGKWKDKKHGNGKLAGAAKLKGGFGEVIVVHYDADGNKTFKRERFKSNGESATQDNLPDKDGMKIKAEHLPLPHDADYTLGENNESVDNSESGNPACGLTDFKSIEVGKDLIDNITTCQVTEFSEPNCTDTTKFEEPSAESGFDDSNAKKPQNRSKPSI